jgi:tRNA pseudouridine55 synthase
MPYSSNKELDGFLVVDKPQGLTSHGVVQEVRRCLGMRRVGHLGTLDPLATGVLPLAAGKATRLVQFLMGGLKVYQGTLRLGFATNTFDGEGHATTEPVTPAFSPRQLLEVRNRLLGTQLQVPPSFSAKRVGGIRSYTLARRGITVSLTPRPVHIEQLELVPQGTTELDFEIHCSAGTYIRSLAHEIGKLLGCGAHLTRLRRLASGEFQLDQAFSLDSFRKLGESELLRHLIPMNNALRSLPEVKVDAEMQGQIAHGRNFAAMVPLSSLSAQPLFRMQSPGGELLGLAELITGQATHKDSDASSSLFHPKVVL